MEHPLPVRQITTRSYSSALPQYAPNSPATGPSWLLIPAALRLESATDCRDASAGRLRHHMVGQTFLSVLRRRDTASRVGARLAAPGNMMKTGECGTVEKVHLGVILSPPGRMKDLVCQKARKMEILRFAQNDVRSSIGTSSAAPVSPVCFGFLMMLRLDAKFLLVPCLFLSSSPRRRGSRLKNGTFCVLLDSRLHGNDAREGRFTWNR